MAIEVKNKTIDGHDYTVTSFDGCEGVKVKAKLMKYFAPALLSLAAIGFTGKKKFSEAEISPESVGSLFQGMADKLNEDEYLEFILRLLRCTRRDDQELTREIFSREFAGEYGSLYKVLFFVLEVNYKDSFFAQGGIGNMLENLKGQLSPS